MIYEIVPMTYATVDHVINSLSPIQSITYANINILMLLFPYIKVLFGVPKITFLI